jgi:hypothetical protein
MYEDWKLFLTIALLVFTILLGSVVFLQLLDLGSCKQLQAIQPEIQPQWTFFNGCMVVNPYTGYLQGMDDWSKSQNYINIDDNR